MRTRPRSLALAAAGIGFTLALGSGALAAPQASLPDAELIIDAPGPPPGGLNQTFAFDAGTQEFVANASGSFGGLDVTFSAVGDPDPSLSYQLTVQNQSAGARDFFLLFRIPTGAVFQADSVSATLTGELVDRNGGSVFLRRVGIDPIQQSNAIVKTAQGVPIAVVLGVPLGTTDISAAGPIDLDAGPLPGPDPTAFGEAFTSLEVRLHFGLSAGDQATLNGTVVMVPELSGLAALGVAIAGLTGIARRRPRQRPSPSRPSQPA